MVKRLFAGLLGAAVYCGAGVALAQGTTAQDTSALMAEGTAAARSGDFAAAKKAFGAAHRAAPDWRTTSGLGNAECQLGEHASGATRLTKALQLLPNDYENHAAIRAGLGARLQECAAEAAVVRFVIEPAGAEVLVDGETIGRAPIVDVTYVGAGPRSIQARLAGHEPVTITIDAPKGVETTATIALRPASDGNLPPINATHDERANWFGITATVAGAVGAIVGIGLILAGSSEASKAIDIRQSLLEANPSEPNPCGIGPSLPTSCQDLRSSAEAHERLQAGGIAALAIGGSIAAIGVVTLLMDGTDGTERSADVNFHVSPIVSANYGGVILTAGF